MGNIVGKKFGVVASTGYERALEESVKEGNQGKFYLTEYKGKGFNDIDIKTIESRNTLIVDGNKIIGVSDTDVQKLTRLSSNPNYFSYRGDVNFSTALPDNANIGDVYNINSEFNLGTNIWYPAYTSVICIGTDSVTGKNVWKPLGGTLEIGKPAFGYIDGSYHVLHFGTDSTKMYPISSFDIYLSSGLHSVNSSIGLELSTYTYYNNSELNTSGLTIDEHGLKLALASNFSYKNQENEFIDALDIVGTDKAEYGGLTISAEKLINYLKLSSFFNNHINSLITQRLTIK